MRAEDVLSLPLGIYVLEWREGGESLAAVGATESGGRWYAPINWIGFKPGWPERCDWTMVRDVRLALTLHDLRQDDDDKADRLTNIENVENEGRGWSAGPSDLIARFDDTCWDCGAEGHSHCGRD